MASGLFWTLYYLGFFLSWFIDIHILVISVVTNRYQGTILFIEVVDKHHHSFIGLFKRAIPLKIMPTDFTHNINASMTSMDLALVSEIDEKIWKLFDTDIFPNALDLLNLCQLIKYKYPKLLSCGTGVNQMLTPKMRRQLMIYAENIEWFIYKVEHEYRTLVLPPTENIVEMEIEEFKNEESQI